MQSSSSVYSPSSAEFWLSSPQFWPMCLSSPKNAAKSSMLSASSSDTCNFKYLIVEKILQALYIFFTADMIILGFFMLFAAPEDYFGNRHWLGVYGILTMILGPIMIRLVYELLMMAVLLLKNVISINNKLRSQNGNEEKNGIFMAPDMGDLRQQLRSKAAQPQNPQPKVPQSAPVAKFCGKCGSPLNEAGKCPNCDNNQPQA